VKPLKILHCHSTFSLGGKEARAVRLMNAFGDHAEHSILSSVPDALGAREAIDSAISVTFPGDNFPPLYGKPSIGRYRDLAAHMKQFDLVLSYNWGSMDAVGAHRLFGGSGPPLIHHEDGFNADEAVKLNWKRNGFRRLMLPTTKALVVPSQRLEQIARTVWKQPAKRLERISNGIPVADYAQLPKADAIPGLIKQDGDVIIGTLAGLRTVKDLPRLVRAVAPLPKNVRLVIIGEGPEREAIIRTAMAENMADRLILPGFMTAPHRFVGLFDIFALSSKSEQFPISVVEAMAAGLPVVSPDVGDVASIVDEANRPLINSDETAYRANLATLVEDAALRSHIGRANRAKAAEHYDEDVMIDRYAQLYSIPDWPESGAS
jgi:L-malate glycosyltransferase